jgi:hypothetical protein
MLVTLVVRLVPEKLAAGEFVGEVEHVGDGKHELVRTVSELVDFAQRAAAGSEPGKSGGVRGAR